MTHINGRKQNNDILNVLIVDSFIHKAVLEREREKPISLETSFKRNI